MAGKTRIPARGLRELGERLRRHRLELGWTQAQLGARASVSSHSISRIERGLERPRRTTLEALARAMGVEPERLSGEDSQPRLFPLPDELRVRLVRALLALGDDDLERLEPELSALLKRRSPVGREKEGR